MVLKLIIIIYLIPHLYCIPFQVACWFFIGECIGKGSLVGYNV